MFGRSCQILAFLFCINLIGGSGHVVQCSVQMSVVKEIWTSICEACFLCLSFLLSDLGPKGL